MPSMISFMRAGIEAVVAPTNGRERLRDRMLRVAREEVRDLRAPPRELGARHADVAHLVGDVVDLAAEGVERGDRAAPLRRAGRGSCSRSSSRSSRPSAGSTRPASRARSSAVIAMIRSPIAACASTGRWRKTSPPRGVDLVEDRARRRARWRGSRGRGGPEARAERPARDEQRARARALECHEARASARPRGALAMCVLGARRSARGPPAGCRRGPCASPTATSCQKLMSCSAEQMRVGLLARELGACRRAFSKQMQHEAARRDWRSGAE